MIMNEIRNKNRVTKETDSAINNDEEGLKNSQLNAVKDGIERFYTDPKLELLKELAEECRHDPALLNEVQQEQREMLEERQFGQTEAIYRMVSMQDDKINLLEERSKRMEALLSTMVSLLVEKQLGVSDKEYERWIQRKSLTNFLEELS